MVLKQTISLSCDRLNSHTCDRCAPNLVGPQLIQADENSSIVNQIQPTLTQFKHIWDQEGVISLTVDGQVQFITKRAEQLLSQYFSPLIPNVLPDFIQYWFNYQVLQLINNSNILCSELSLFMDNSERKLIIRCVVDAFKEHYLLLLKEEKTLSFSVVALESLGLTKREAEVLFWISKDKNNAGIARVLGCSEGTVRKHLENLYKKLGVQTRVGAVMIALEKLGFFKE